MNKTFMEMAAQTSMMELETQAEKSSRFNSSFCLHMANHILQTNAAKGLNTVISPLSFHLMLSLIAVGSKGRTSEQLLNCLGSRSIQDLNSLSSQMIALVSPANESNGFGRARGDPGLAFVNGAWVAQGLKLKPSFQEVVARVYNATAKEVDFVNRAAEVVAEINAWAETATEGLIKDLLDAEAVAPGTVVILANALYFKGTWAQPFDTSKTKNRAFHLLNGQTVDVPFITSVPFEFYHYGSFEGYKVVKLPYRNDQTTRKFAMYIFLPDARHGLKNLLQMFKYNPEYFNRQLTQLYLPTEVISNFWIPRFKFSFEFEASDTIKELGLELPFDDRNSEITEMVESVHRVYVNKMFHKSFIEVNEEGTEAAASTAAMAVFGAAKPIIPSFVADHPFMFMIKEETTGSVFFVGAMLNPLLLS